MVPVVRISDQTWEAMKTLALPFEKPDELIARAMAHLAATPAAERPAAPAKPQQAPRSLGHLRSTDFTQPIQDCLREAGGRETVPRVRAWLERRMGHRFTDADREILPTAKEPRWWKNAAWERNRLARAGVIRDDSPRGIWELADPAPALRSAKH
ncbi:winged helix-turn-helix domain-containing protein [Roseicella aquatilis]|uniref:Restriction system protein Mrr-like N-terminal domain-containing protein n=1 Tax=Roseicella aquatilis TaxID=2527868 RepID=A0A4R4D733_9PROT|nr:winged helix-turn-helix domain-containing protein [Roseicella aquatilis]TCZ54589.1 hypothetical protein EXY23_23235 [Roseicella aquatilis]